MRQVHEALIQEEQYLLKLIKQVKGALSNAPEGRLRIARKGKTVQYYYKNKEDIIKKANQTPQVSLEIKHMPQGKYLRKSDIQLAKDIAQRDYDLHILEIAEKRLKIIQDLIQSYQNSKMEDIYDKLNSYRKELVAPRIITEKEYVKNWSEVKYVGKTFEEGTAVLCSNKGERVRSKSEKIIADMLLKSGVQYRYEAPITLHGIGTVYPDFTILNIKERKEIYWEHLGMMDNKEYCEMALRKIDTYQRNGIFLGDRLIITWETLKYPLETAAISRNIKEFCIK